MHEELESLSKVVPEVPELLLDDCSRISGETRVKIIAQHRNATLIPLIRATHYPASILPPKDQLFDVIHATQQDCLCQISPQQVQHISLLAEFVHKNPVSIIKVLKHVFSKNKMEEFTFLCYSSIPSFFGFFSSAELMSFAFPFYCTLVGTADQSIAHHALIPFYCNACTFRFTEMVYDRFGQSFCNDLRIDTKKIQKEILAEYVEPLISAIEYAFPLLPQPHQFLLRFMITRGWAETRVLNFFLHEFALPQLLRYVKSGPFVLHFEQLKHLCMSIQSNPKPAMRLLKIFESKSVVEIPSAFSVFNIPFSQLVLTTCDVHILIQNLIQVKEVPISVRPFIDNWYFKSVSYQPFWIRVYSRTPKPVETSYNWRNVVFTLPETQAPENVHFERVRRELKMRCDDFGISISDFLKGTNLSYSETQVLSSIKQILGEKFDGFTEYVREHNFREIQARSEVFERYLVHSMALQSLLKWKEVVNSYYTVTVTSIVQERMKGVLTSKGGTKSITGILEPVFSIIDNLTIRQLCFTMTIGYMLPDILSTSVINRMKLIERSWKSHVERARGMIVLPPSFRSGHGNQKTVLQLNKKLWSAIEQLKCISRVKFEWILKIVFEALGQLDELVRMDDLESSVIQFALAFSDCPIFISRFVIINTFIVKQKLFHVVGGNREMTLWSRLESGILKLLNRDEKLMIEFLAFQDELMNTQIVC